MKKKNKKETTDVVWDYNKSEMFLHCKHCLDDVPEEESPESWMKYQASSYPYTYEDGHKENILVIWCKRCKRQVWDTSHLTIR